MKYEKYIKYGFIILCVLLLLYFSPALINLFLPFILAFLIAVPCHKLVEFLAAKLHIHRGLSSAVIFTLIISLIAGVVFLVLYYIIGQFRNFAAVVPDMLGSLVEYFANLYEKYKSIAPRLAEFIDGYLERRPISISTYTPKITDSAINYATGIAASIPSAMFFALIFLLSVFFFIKDYNAVVNFFREAVPESWRPRIRYLKHTAWRGFVGYIKSQFILSAVTTVLVAVTFWILGVDYAVIWGIIVGIVDALPILGSGIVLIPYAIIHFMMTKELFLSICIVILQVVVFVVRQALSPRVMSSQLGLHPILTLISIYVGNKIMGVLGMIIFPIFAILLVSLYTSYKNAENFKN